jgi:alkanesulfonate monooxygenase SsuD/methylene tetrahydromethanopterin reductase-like flavin-dependent oxidoreductase (luciferase family)
MTSSRQLHLGAFMRPASIHTGAWRYPGAWPDMNFNFAHMKRCIQSLERAKFDAFFMADHGFTVMFPYLPGGLDDFVDRVIPELHRRGLFRREYEGVTLREHLGLPRPANRFFQN